jgi:hypothetical protein
MAATATAATGLDRLRHRLRVPVFTAATVTLGIGAHLAAGGVAPSASLLGLITAVVTALCAATAGRELRLPALLGAVALTEAGIHVALLGQDHAAHGAARSGSAAMLLAHMAASVLLAWWLRRGEAAVWRAVQRAGSLLALATAGPPLQLPRVPRPRTGIRPRPLRRLHVGPVHPVRGPPCVA